MRRIIGLPLQVLGALIILSGFVVSGMTFAFGCGVFWIIPDRACRSGFVGAVVIWVGSLVVGAPIAWIGGRVAGTDMDD
jgi:hypothetical protein